MVNWRDILEYGYHCLGSRKKSDEGKKRVENTEEIELENNPVIITSEESRLEIEETSVEVTDNSNRGKKREATNLDNWRGIHPDFTSGLQKEWKWAGFDHEQTKEWIDIGLQPSDANYAQWLRDAKKVDAEWFSDYGDEEALRKEFQKFLETKPNSSKKSEKKQSSKEEFFVEPKLFLAIIKNNAEFIKSVIEEEKIDVNSIRDEDGNTLLHYALFLEKIKSARAILDCGGDASAKNNNGLEAVHIVSALKLDIEFSEDLVINRGVNINAQDKGGYTVLHYEMMKKDERPLFIIKNCPELAILLEKKKNKDDKLVNKSEQEASDFSLRNISLKEFQESKSQEISEEITENTEKCLSKKINGKGMHYQFTDNLQKEWEVRGFSYKEAKEWIDIGLTPSEIELVVWLRDEVSKEIENFADPQWVKNNTDLAEIKKEYSKYLENREKKLEVNSLIPLFTPEWQSLFKKIFVGRSLKESVIILNSITILLETTRKIRNNKNSNLERTSDIDVYRDNLRQTWEESGFTPEQVKKLINIGFKLKDAYFCAWLRDVKKINIEEQLDYGNKRESREEYENYVRELKIKEEVIEKIKDFDHRRLTPVQEEVVDQSITNFELRSRYKDNGLCQECQQPNTEYKWCQNCNSKYFQENFKNWTSGDQEIDQFIQEQQLKATGQYEVLEWISYENFTEIEYLAEGGFGKVYKAKWPNGGLIENWNFQNNCWDREEKIDDNLIVALKTLNNSQGVDTDFLREVANHKVRGVGIINCYGISQDPVTKDYLMIMEYKKNGNLRQFSQNEYNKTATKFGSKTLQLLIIARGLNTIHEHGLMHRDLHAGNILVETGQGADFCFITDLGLCRPANETDKGKVYGVLPYVAPEVLLGEPYTQASDVYSFAMIVYEIFSGLPPYHEFAHNEPFALKICQGLRPNLDDATIPQLVKDLVKRCWDANPLKRPTAEELWEISANWFRDIFPSKEDGVADKNAEYYKQCSEARINTEVIAARKVYPQLLSKLYEQYKGQTKEIKLEEAEKVKIELFLPFCEQRNLSWILDESWETFSKFLDSELRSVISSSPNFFRIHPNAVYHSQLINTQQIAQLFQESKEQALAQELKKMEREINQPLTNELKELLSNFIQTKKLTIQDEADEVVEDKAWDLEDQLKEQGLSQENIEKIMKYCERFVKAEQQLEANIEIPTNQ